MVEVKNIMWKQYLYHSALLSGGFGLLAKACGLLYSKNDTKSLLGLSIRDLWNVNLII
jgi:hypothetical protein